MVACASGMCLRHQFGLEPRQGNKGATTQERRQHTDGRRKSVKHGQYDASPRILARPPHSMASRTLLGIRQEVGAGEVLSIPFVVVCLTLAIRN
ncbi:MAG: hypothetical protein MZW92_16650, partial [Comamonadaceae bacterium]|nr:hypothetical protein [Comamonadaceae bacterium]